MNKGKINIVLVKSKINKTSIPESIILHDHNITLCNNFKSLDIHIDEFSSFSLKIGMEMIGDLFDRVLIVPVVLFDKIDLEQLDKPNHQKFP